MNRCLQAPEILRLICDQLPTSGPEDRQQVLAIALSCRAFLDPGLDRLWHTIKSFQILRSTLPSDVWKVKTAVVGVRRQTYEVLNLRRAITVQDMERYLSFYASRIRNVHLSGVRLTLSVEAWQNLHLAINFQPGALAPQATQLGWCLAHSMELGIAQDVLNQTWPYFTLFCAPSVTTLDFTFLSSRPIQVACLQNAARHPALKELRMIDLEHGNPESVGFIASLPWNRLQVLEIGQLSGGTLGHLLTLPCLRSLKVGRLENVARLHPYVPGEDDSTSTHDHALLTNAFPSLESLDVRSRCFTNLTGLLQRIPASNRIHTLHCYINGVTEQEALREFLAALSDHCNEGSLQNLTLEDLTCQDDWEERKEIDISSPLDITLFFKFERLEKVSINLSESVCLTPEEIHGIVSSWPMLRELNIDVEFPSSRLPCIDHTNFLTLLYGCRHLERLGLYFNATQITGPDPVPLSVPRPYQGALEPAPLKYLNPGASPIYSPLKVTDFLRMHCPMLFLLRNSFTYLSTDDLRPNVFNSMYEDRWRVVSSLGSKPAVFRGPGAG